VTELADWNHRYCPHCGTVTKGSTDDETGEFVEQCPKCNGLWINGEEC